MVCRMWTPKVPAAWQQAQRTWEVGAVRGEVGGARVLHQDQVVPIEISMMQAVGPVNTAHFQMSSQPPSAWCAISAGEPRTPGKLCHLDTDISVLPLLAGRLIWWSILDGISWRRVFNWSLASGIIYTRKYVKSTGGMEIGEITVLCLSVVLLDYEMYIGYAVCCHTCTVAISGSMQKHSSVILAVASSKAPRQL